MADLDPDEVAAYLAFWFARNTPKRDPLGYAVVELDVTCKAPEPFGPGDVMLVIDADLESAKRKRDQMPALYRDRYVVCKLVPIEGESP
jgi:hypothetical protein